MQNPWEIPIYRARRLVIHKVSSLAHLQTQKLERKENQKDKQKRKFEVAETKLVWIIVKFPIQTQFYQANLPSETQLDKTKGRLYETWSNGRSSESI